MSYIRTLLIATSAVLVMAMLSPDVRAGDWEHLGSRQVSFAGEKDKIMVTGHEGRFTAIKLDVDRGNLELYNIKVTFGNGETFSPGTRLVFKEGERSRTIDLPGGARIIRKVEFWYRSKIRRGRATMKLYGRHGGPAAAPARWEHLGSRKVSFAAEKDKIMVTGHEGRFNAIKIDVNEGNLEMYNIKVTFGNGESWSPDTRFVFQEGERSRTIDLPGEARIIRKVEFWYRSKLRKGKATLDLYGRHPGAAPEPVPAVRWEHLGDRQVSFAAEKDKIMVTASEGRFTAIKIDVNQGDLEMFNVKVTFGNGETFSPGTRFVFNQNTRSRTIDLPGEARIIRKVEFWYHSKIRRGKAKISLYGRHGG